MNSLDKLKPDEDNIIITPRGHFFKDQWGKYWKLKGDSNFLNL